MKRHGSVLLSAVLVSLLVSACGGGSPEYKQWQSYYKSLGGNPDDYSEDVVEGFPDHCGFIQAGRRPGRIIDDESVRFYGAAIAAYCPDAMAPFMTTISGEALDAEAAIREQAWSGLPQAKSFDTPTFSSTATRDLAFAGDVGSLMTWQTFGPASWVVGGANSAGDFRREVVSLAAATCSALSGGEDPNDVPRSTQLPLRDTVDQAAFLVEAITFYCPENMAKFTKGLYAIPKSTPQVENCPTSTARMTLKGRITDSWDDGTMADYEITVTNPYSYDVLLRLQTRFQVSGSAYPGADRWVPEWVDDTDGSISTTHRIAAGETKVLKRDQGGVYRWKSVDVRIKPGDVLFLNCGYKPGERPSA